MTPDYDDGEMWGYTEEYLKNIWGKEKYAAFTRWMVGQTMGLVEGNKVIYWPTDVHRFDVYEEKAKVWD